MSDYKYIHSQDLNSEALNYQAVSFHPKAKNSRRPSETQLEPHVVYAATR